MCSQDQMEMGRRIVMYLLLKQLKASGVESTLEAIFSGTREAQAMFSYLEGPAKLSQIKIELGKLLDSKTAQQRFIHRNSKSSQVRFTPNPPHSILLSSLSYNLPEIPSLLPALILIPPLHRAPSWRSALKILRLGSIQTFPRRTLRAYFKFPRLWRRHLPRSPEPFPPSRHVTPPESGAGQISIHMTPSMNMVQVVRKY
jgi:hypothetical protein